MITTGYAIIKLMYHNMMYIEMRYLQDVSCDYKWWVFDLVHEYHTSGHYSRS
jgi:hypothetical protein